MASFRSVASIFCFLLLYVNATENSLLSQDAEENFEMTSMEGPEQRLIEALPLLTSLTRKQRHALAVELPSDSKVLKKIAQSRQVETFKNHLARKIDSLPRRTKRQLASANPTQTEAKPPAANVTLARRKQNVPKESSGQTEVPSETDVSEAKVPLQRELSQLLYPGSVTGFREPDVNKRAMFQQVMMTSMKQPESQQRLIEVMPLLRSLTRGQRHALADMLHNVSQAFIQATQLRHQQLARQHQSNATSSPPVNPKPMVNASLPRLLPQLDVVSLLQKGASEAQREAQEEAKRTAIEAIASLPESRSFDTAQESNETMPEELPQALESRWKMTPEEFMAFLSEHRKFQLMTKRRRQPPARVSVGLRPPPLPKGEECDLFSNNLCLEVPNYPTDAIIASMKRSTTSLLGVLAREIATEPTSDRRQDVEENLVGGDNENGATLCQSITKFARPKRARNVNGQWKYLVNTGDEHSQTLRIELCTEPGESCNYLANGVASQCVQIYTHHRLLAWDYEKGLFLDLFKVPTCCSCHVQPAYGPAVFPATTPSKPRGPPPAFDSEPEYMEEDASSFETHNARPMHIPVPWPTKPAMPPHTTKRPSSAKNTPLKPHRLPAPVHEYTTQPPFHPKEGRKRNRPGEKIRPDLDEAGATATHRRRRPPASERVRESSESEEGSRINYSYHPIIDFFRNEERQKQADRRTGGGGPVVYVEDDWRPIEPSFRPPVRRI
ncbi:uncharacterized protein LOC132198392 [Neocloeon triangulifer]|uniref:uncharacterized protein LOC132198392 n=1 Tax=Neocloeon triangulifer TaxID=2078957 RepID=UPI00286EE1A1|nr:uncharacterized protein LOC132198392 [Neocloeon triangulifer]